MLYGLRPLLLGDELWLLPANPSADGEVDILGVAWSPVVLSATAILGLVTISAVVVGGVLSAAERSSASVQMVADPTARRQFEPRRIPRATHRAAVCAAGVGGHGDRCDVRVPRGRC